MKKIVAVAAFFLIGLTLCSAQTENMRFGFQLSPTFSWMNTTDNQINRNGTNLGVKLGMLAEYYFQDNYAISTGIGFGFNQGGKLQFEYGGNYWIRSDIGPMFDTLPAGVNLKYNLQFLEIPIGIKMRTREFGYLRYFLEPGLVLGFNTQARGSIEGRGIGDDVQKIKISKEVNGINLSWGINGGIEYSLTETTALVAGAGFQIGFVDITNDRGTVFDPDRGNKREDSKGTTSAFVMKLGIMF